MYACMRSSGSLLVELTSTHDSHTLFARLKSSGKDLGEGVMAGGAGEAYASFARRHSESRRSVFGVYEKANSVTSDRTTGICQNDGDTVKEIVSE